MVGIIYYRLKLNRELLISQRIDFNFFFLTSGQPLYLYRFSEWRFVQYIAQWYYRVHDTLAFPIPIIVMISIFDRDELIDRYYRLPVTIIIINFPFSLSHSVSVNGICTLFWCILTRKIVGIDDIQMENLNTSTTKHCVLVKKRSTILSWLRVKNHTEFTVIPSTSQNGYVKSKTNCFFAML